MSSSDDSDDEFLTLAGEGGGDKAGGALDREALVRKKLLENFYGKNAVAAAEASGGGINRVLSEDSYDDDDYHGSDRRVRGDANDLDSPAFESEAYTRRHVLGSSMHTLLETEEKLALQVRTLDSTMQTLVYENYSRFIDATDAIRSIGVNVQANEEGLVRLTQGMNAMDEHSKSIEDALGSLRDQVAEKIRVKRLLTRLDSLLKLPETLKRQIAEGKYRTATKSYLSASSILSKHSEGFESLRTIETECNSILQEMKNDIKHKILHWSGRLTGSFEDDDEEGLGASQSAPSRSNAPAAPRSITEIFECSGTLFMLLLEGGNTDGALLNDASDLHPLDAEELKSLSVAASMRLLDRLLDSHMIEIQERRFAVPTPSMDMSSRGDPANLGASLSSLQQPSLEPKGVALVPSLVLDGILEGASLFRSSFGDDENSSSGGYLLEFVSEAFSTFMIHVRAILLEESTPPGVNDDAMDDEDGHDDAGASSAQEEVSWALSLLGSSARELASRLSSPEVGLSPHYTSTMVDQVMDLTQFMVRRRVDQEFLKLRQSVVRTCLIPFVERAIAERSEALASGEPVLRAITQTGSSTLSDCLQLVDDTIRSIFSTGDVASESDDLPILKQAVLSSTNRFALWLASAFEILAGGESSDPMRVIDTPMEVLPGHEDEKEESFEGSEVRVNKSIIQDDLGDLDAAVVDLVDAAHKTLLRVGDGSGNTVDSDFVLGIAEMCRLAKGSVSDNLKQSIASHIGGGRKKGRGMFPSGEAPVNRGSHDENEDEITKRFGIAASRLVVLFALTRGSEMGNRLCRNLGDDVESDDAGVEPSKPRPKVLDALEIVKHTSIECTGLYGGKQRGGPVPKMEDDGMSGFGALSSPLMARKTGLHLDVERMFQEKVVIFPHPFETLETSRDAILFLVCKVAFRDLLENVRMYRVSATGFRQMQIDVELLKLLLPHYISSDYSSHGNNACTSLSNLLGDVMMNAGDRCVEAELGDDENVRRQSRDCVREFMDEVESSAELADKFIVEDDS